MSNVKEVMVLLKNEIVYFKKLKAAIGDIHGHIHSLAVRVASIYLADKYPQAVNWEISEKYEAGLDIVGKATDGNAIVAAEVKTTARSEKETLGRTQKDRIKNDIEKLKSTGAKNKYLFIIDNKNKKAFESILKNNQGMDIELLNIFEC